MNFPVAILFIFLSLCYRNDEIEALSVSETFFSRSNWAWHTHISINKLRDSDVAEHQIDFFFKKKVEEPNRDRVSTCCFLIVAPKQQTNSTALRSFCLTLSLSMVLQFGVLFRFESNRWLHTSSLSSCNGSALALK